jgi:hypothetical protein
MPNTRIDAYIHDPFTVFENVHRQVPTTYNVLCLVGPECAHTPCHEANSSADPQENTVISSLLARVPTWRQSSMDASQAVGIEIFPQDRSSQESHAHVLIV